MKQYMKPLLLKKLYRAFFTLLIGLAGTQLLPADGAVPRVSVAPLSYSVGVLARDAEILGQLFETALIRSKAFTVIKQSELETILEAQEASLQDFADRDFAVELGKIISANHIFVGSVARFGRTYVVNLQLVDVETGRAIEAEAAETRSADGFLEIMRNLADLFSGTDTGRSSMPATDYRVRTYLDIGDRFMALRRYEAAIAQYEKALAIDEFNVDVLWRITTAVKEDLLSKSLYSFNAISSGLDVALRGDYQRIRLLDRGDAEAALEKIYTIQAIEPLLQDNAELLLDEAMVFKMDGRVSDTLQVLRRAFKMYPENPFVLAELGLLTVFEAQQAPERRKGLELIRKAVTSNPETALFHFYLGRSLERRETVPSAAAIRAYRRAAELSFGTDFWSRRVRAFAQQSMQRIYYQLGRLENGVLTGQLDMRREERLDHMEYLVANSVPFPTKSTLQNPDYYLAQLYFSTNRVAGAQTAISRLLPEDPEAWRSFQVPWLELYEKILRRTDGNAALLSTVRAKLKSFRKD